MISFTLRTYELSTHDTQAQSGSIPRSLPSQVDVRANHSGETAHGASDSDRDMSLPIGFGIVTDPSQITGVTQFSTSRNEDTSEVSRANESRLDWEGEYEDETDQDHCLTE
jgi:hypothetical protein